MDVLILSIYVCGKWLNRKHFETTCSKKGGRHSHHSGSAGLGVDVGGGTERLLRSWKNCIFTGLGIT